MRYLVGYELVYQQLSVELRRMPDIDRPVQTGRRLVRAAVLLLSGDEENDGIEIGKIVMVGTAEHDIPEDAEPHPFGGVDAQVMDDAIFLGGIHSRSRGDVLIDELHVRRLVIQLPYPHVEPGRKR